MPEGKTETPSRTEVKETGSLLTPEQMVESQARHEIRKYEDSLLEAGVSKEKVEQSAELASEAAVLEYKELIAQNPIESVNQILDKIVDSLEGDERALVEKHRVWSANFASKWRDKVELWRERVVKNGKDLTVAELLEKISLNNDGATLLFPREGGWHAILPLVSARTRRVIDENVGWDDPGSRDFITLSPEGVRTVFEAFDAEVPTLNQQIKNGENIETKLPGVGITVHPEWGNVWLEFSPKALERVVTLPQDNE